jgi:hypothetical protein
MRICRSLVLTISLVFPCSFFGQSTNAALTGVVDDPSKAVVVGAQITAINTETGVKSSTTTNNSGVYVLPGLIPGTYRIEVDKQGFKGIIEGGLVLHVQDVVQLNFHMALGSASETVTVTSDQLNVNTTDASVSTIVDHSYVENMPLNGRSLQSLFLLTPGITNATPQTGALGGVSGEFNVNGQRDDANNFSVDGVSANVGTYKYAFGTNGSSGSLPGESALGTTQNLVSLDALQEFRVEASTYSAEYGRKPGGQFMFLTRSGTNQWHGTASDYLRNTVFDANNWFNDYFGQPNPGERQNDFGGTLGGPVEIPHLYDGKDKTFFFFSYEGVRLGQPVAATVTQVPDLSMRQSAPTALQAVFNAYPIPNGPETGTGLAEFIGTGTTPNSIDSTSFRLDHAVGAKSRLFFRFANTTSNSGLFGESNNQFGFRSALIQNMRSYTVGANSVLTNNLSNELRFNYTHNLAGNSLIPESFGGGVAADLAAMSGIPANTPTYDVGVYLEFGDYNAEMLQGKFRSPLTQWNLTDTASLAYGHHLLKFGIDYRRIEPDIMGEGNPLIAQFYFSESDAIANAPDLTEIVVNKPVYPVFINNSLFAQDQWKVTPKLSLSLGLRWELNPAPGSRNHTAPYVLENAQNPSQATVAPYGTPLYNTYWYDFGPRLGAAYLLRTSPGWETVVRGGGGLFFDTAQTTAGGLYGFGQPGYGAELVTSLPWALTAAEEALPVANPPVPPYGTFYAFPKHLQAPYSLQWNASTQQSLGSSQTLTVSYVGSHVARLAGLNYDSVGGLNPNFSEINYVTSGFTADYNSLQVQFQRNLSRGLQMLASYTYAHCIDYSSNDLGTYIVPQRGNCDYDLRHSLSTAFSYNIPNAFQNGFARAVLSHWGLDDRFTARTGFPVQPYGNFFINPSNGQEMFGTLDILPGQPFYLYGSQYPGGREINPAAFSEPAAGTSGDAPRNFLRGLGAWQMDLAVRREFPLYERLKLQFRAEAFNIFNHPNFGTVNPYYCSPNPSSPAYSAACTFGQATATLNVSLGALSPLYQLGGPRSMQFALRLQF